MCYVKYSPAIFPASFTNRVAPLPEFKTGMGMEDQRGQELESERRSIEADNRMFRVVEEEKEAPFPMLMKVEKKQAEKTVYDLKEAIRPVKGVSGAVVLPHGTGKIFKVAVFADGAAADEARAAGADIVGGDELIEKIRTKGHALQSSQKFPKIGKSYQETCSQFLEEGANLFNDLSAMHGMGSSYSENKCMFIDTCPSILSGGKINFDKCIATHSMMQHVTRGTVTNNVAAAVKEAKQGLLDFRMKDAIVRVGLGKYTFFHFSFKEGGGLGSADVVLP
ncbi:hypothetical protein Cgig2_027876 [Carnegiea gigantea]|uniref:50S ribosomal protein L1 n=1 Tax=Carnegiea gigantea TaxID=171969 RepID=A0A9Q1KMR0_9CARY|nr:hypothetical protein Cgig2_027876 [Carnegiea gigantea]